MKKLFLALVLVFVVLAGITALPSDFRLKAMGNANATGNGDCGIVFNNPASIYFHNSSDFLTVHTSLYDRHESGEGRNFPFLPGGDFHARFAGKFLSFTGSLVTQSFFLRSDDDGLKYYDSLRTFSADVAATVGWNDIIAAGIGLNAGLSSERAGFQVADNSRFMDFVLNMLTGEYTRIDASEFASVRAGVQISVGAFRVGVLAPQVYTYAKDKGVFSAEGLSGGIAYEGSKYHGRARLNTVVVSALVEIHNMAGEHKSLHVGGELTMNITSSNNVSVRAGYECFLKDYLNGTLTLGACAVMGEFEINGYVGLEINNPGTVQYALDFVFYY
jgi:hypothetical protein